MTHSPMNCRFDKWAARHPKRAAQQWERSSPSRRKALLSDVLDTTPEYNASYTWYKMRQKAGLLA